MVSDSLSRNIRVGNINKILQQHSDVESLQESVRIDKFPGATADKFAHCSKFSIEALKPVQLFVIAGTNDISYSNGEIDPEILAVRILNIGIQAVEMGVKCVCIQGIPTRRGRKYNDLIRQVNLYLQTFCKDAGFVFKSSDDIDRFSDLNRDGLHLNFRGTQKLIYSILSSQSSFNPFYGPLKDTIDSWGLGGY